MHHRAHDHDRGLAFDLATLSDRRGVLKFMAGAALLTVAGCGSSSDESSTPTTGSSPGPMTGPDSTCSAIPRETAGPFPGDGSNGPNVLTQSGIVRRDIRRSFGSASGVAEGVPLTVTLTVLDIAKGCSPRAGAAVYVWQCSREGLYSLYSPGATGENYLRGSRRPTATGAPPSPASSPPPIQAGGRTSISRSIPAWPRRRAPGPSWPRPSWPCPRTCDLVFATEGYGQSVRNLARTSLERDNVFANGYSAQLASVSGGVDTGLTAAHRSRVETTSTAV